MRWSDEERLERVYRRAASIRYQRRMTAMVGAVVVVLLGWGVVAAASTDDGRRLEVAGPSTTVDPPVTLTTPPTHIGPTVLPTVTTPTTGTSLPVKPTVTTETTTPPTTTVLPNCGGYSPGGSRPSPPQGMIVTTEASKQTVRRGESVVLTMRARWTGTEPYSYSRSGDYMMLGTLSGMIYYSTQYAPHEPAQSGPDTFQPGEEKTVSVTWDTRYVCTGNQHREARTPAGTYVIEGFWDGPGSWGADPGRFEIVD